MRFIPTTLHSVLDYSTALVLLVAPYTFKFAYGGAELCWRSSPASSSPPTAS